MKKSAQNDPAGVYLGRICAAIKDSVVTDAKARRVSMAAAASAVVALFRKVGRTGKKIMLIGNGGSAAIVSHAHNDFCKSAGVRAMAFHEIPLLTALSNDDHYENTFDWNVRQWAEKGDVLLAVSSSGKSANILKAVKTARKASCAVVTFSGFKPRNPLRAAGALNFYVPSGHYGLVEIAHSALLHMLTDLTAGKGA